MLGENTEEGGKFREDLNETHHLFKDFVHRMRPGLDIEQVATGEHWVRGAGAGKRDWWMRLKPAMSCCWG
ncbi:hypothetical protein LNQ03_32965 [Klebsiella pneumoniae subsp. pneumoniae]|nr:hypothetical protein [Klebsiella pneumoniae subsp. pneumoniae]